MYFCVEGTGEEMGSRGDGVWGFFPFARTIAARNARQTDTGTVPERVMAYRTLGGIST